MLAEARTESGSRVVALDSLQQLGAFAPGPAVLPVASRPPDRPYGARDGDAPPARKRRKGKDAAPSKDGEHHAGVVDGLREAVAILAGLIDAWPDGEGAAAFRGDEEVSELPFAVIASEHKAITSTAGVQLDTRAADDVRSLRSLLNRVHMHAGDGHLALRVSHDAVEHEFSRPPRSAFLLADMDCWQEPLEAFGASLLASPHLIIQPEGLQASISCSPIRHGRISRPREPSRTSCSILTRSLTSTSARCSPLRKSLMTPCRGPVLSAYG